MNKYVRRAVIGLLAGGTSSVVLATTLGSALLGLLLGTLHLESCRVRTRLP